MSRNSHWLTGQCPKDYEEFGGRRRVEKWQFSSKFGRICLEKGHFLFVTHGDIWHSPVNELSIAVNGLKSTFVILNNYTYCMQSAHSTITEREIEIILSLIFCLEEDVVIKYSQIRFLSIFHNPRKRNQMDKKIR